MDSEDYPKPLMDAYTGRQLVAIVGAGFTSATSPGSNGSSWPKLIAAGAAELSSNTDWADSKGPIVQQILDGIGANDDTTLLLTAASLVRQGLSSDNAQPFANFLHDNVGQLTPVHRELGKALKKLDVPIATTNYDKLLESALGTDHSVTWNDNDEMLKVLRHEISGVAHLHGVWDKPESVVFASEDYARLTAAEATLFVEASAFAMRTFLFVGMGQGVIDPNFSHIVQIFKKQVGVSNHYHYLLCRQSEMARLKEMLKDTTIRPISYGHEHSELPDYLASVARIAGTTRAESSQQAEWAQNGWGQIARGVFANRLHGSEVDDEATVLEALVEPTFLPLSHEQFVHEKRKLDREHGESTVELVPVKPQQVLDGQRITLIVGEEHGGLTTALQWLALKTTTASSLTVPVFLDARSIRSKDRLKSVVIGELNSLGANLKKQAPLPDVVLAIDNLTYRENEKFKLFCKDITELSARKIFLGCHLGDESELAKLLDSLGAETQTIYLGKVGKQEIQKYAVIIAPNISDQMIGRVLTLISKEHLPRNPFTVSLVLALMLQAASRPDRLQSQTDVLNEYMQLLLSHAGGNLDARETLSVVNLEQVLTQLAYAFVNKRSGSLPATECVNILQNLFQELDWIESPVSWLEKLTAMRVLKNEGSQYSFRQSSYLYLYAAKAAVSDSEFMQLLLSEPLFFAPIIKHCAALQRNNAELVRATEKLLQEWSEYKHTGRIFEETDKTEAPDFEDSNADGESDEAESDNSDETTESSPSSDEATANASSYDLSGDKDVIPFPLDDIRQKTWASQLNIAVNLASNVLRDSDAISNKVVKDNALLAILHSWGVLMDLIETDERVREGIRRILEDGVEQEFYTQEFAEKVLKTLHSEYACLFVANGINESLRSRKLTPAIERLYEEDRVISRSIYAAGSAAILELLSRQKGWSANLLKLVDTLGGRWISTSFLSLRIRLGYVLDDLSGTDQENYRSIIRVQNAAQFDYKNAKHKKQHSTRDIKRLDDLRTKVGAFRAIERQKRL